MRTPRVRSEESTNASVRRSSSNHPAARWPKSPICRNCGLRSVNRRLTQRQSTTDEVSFEPDVHLLKKVKAEALNSPAAPTPGGGPSPEPEPPGPGPEPGPGPQPPGPEPGPTPTSIRVSGHVRPELWNRLGTKVLPKLRSGEDLQIQVNFTTSVDSSSAGDLQAELRQILQDLGLSDSFEIM